MQQNERLHVKLSFRSPSSPPSNLRVKAHVAETKTGVFIYQKAFSLLVRNKSQNVPEKKRASTVPRRIILAVFGTPGWRGGGTWDGTCGAFSAAPAAPMCAPQTDTQPAATFTAPITIRPPATVKSRKFQKIPRWKHGGASGECVGAKCAPGSRRLSA